jgi:1-acyl-sn-glycerol-3-phosphate acyltransferase
MESSRKAPLAPGEEPSHVEPLSPFTLPETLLSLFLFWPVALVHMIAWLGVFLFLDKRGLASGRYDDLVRVVNRRVTALLGIRVEVHGLERLDPSGRYVFCFNHVSLLDTPVIVQSVPYHARSYQDRAHFRIPVYGSFCRLLGQIPVERDNPELNERAHSRALEMLRGGDSFAVFPEGHRTRDGRLGAFYPGAFRLALEAQVPIAPVVMKGLRNCCPADGWRIRPGCVEVLFGDPIATSGLGPDRQDEVARLTRRAMDELFRRGRQSP